MQSWYIWIYLGYTHKWCLPYFCITLYPCSSRKPCLLKLMVKFVGGLFEDKRWWKLQRSTIFFNKGEPRVPFENDIKWPKKMVKKGAVWQSRNIQMQFLMTSLWQIVSVRLVDCGWFVWLYTVQATALLEWFSTMYPMRFLTISCSNILFDKSPHFCWRNRRPAC